MDIKEILEKALQGRAVVLRDGRKGYVRHVEKKIEAEYPALGFVVRGDGCISAESWTLDGRCVYGSNSGKDIIGLSPLEFDGWNLFDERIVAIAKDSGGEWWAYEETPEFSGDWRGGFVCSLGFLRVDFPDCDWKDSLIVRPVNGDSE